MGEADRDQHGAERSAPILMSAPSDPVEGAADRIALAEALGGLDAEHRVVLALHYLEGEPVASISRLLGIPEGTVKSRLHAGRARLRAALEGPDGRV
jgi:RNA polymerase sigma-70 factor (ECF subfamily)